MRNKYKVPTDFLTPVKKKPLNNSKIRIYRWCLFDCSISRIECGGISPFLANVDHVESVCGSRVQAERENGN